jgi:mRNA interferase MazF
MASPSAIRGKVVLVAFPFDDLSGSKVRPAVCLTEPIGPHHHVVLAFVTSQVEAAPLASDLILAPGDPGFAQTGLRAPSTLRLHRLMTASTVLIRRDLGRLSAAHLEAVDARLHHLFRSS